MFDIPSDISSHLLTFQISVASSRTWCDITSIRTEIYDILTFLLTDRIMTFLWTYFHDIYFDTASDISFDICFDIPFPLALILALLTFDIC